MKLHCYCSILYPQLSTPINDQFIVDLFKSNPINIELLDSFKDEFPGYSLDLSMSADDIQVSMSLIVEEIEGLQRNVAFTDKLYKSSFIKTVSDTKESARLLLEVNYIKSLSTTNLAEIDLDGQLTLDCRDTEGIELKSIKSIKFNSLYKFHIVQQSSQESRELSLTKLNLFSNVYFGKIRFGIGIFKLVNPIEYKLQINCYPDLNDILIFNDLHYIDLHPSTVSICNDEYTISLFKDQELIQLLIDRQLDIVFE